jgi:hypothetical protein
MYSQFTEHISSGNLINRNSVIYLKSNKYLFFPCVLFSKQDTVLSDTEKVCYIGWENLASTHRRPRTFSGSLLWFLEVGVHGKWDERKTRHWWYDSKSVARMKRWRELPRSVFPWKNNLISLEVPVKTKETRLAASFWILWEKLVTWCSQYRWTLKVT